MFDVFIFLYLLAGDACTQAARCRGPESAVLSVVLCFSLGTQRTSGSCRKGNGALTALSSLLTRPTHDERLCSVVLISPSSCGKGGRPSVTPNLGEDRRMGTFLYQGCPRIGTTRVYVHAKRRCKSTLQGLVASSELIPSQRSMLTLVSCRRSGPMGVRSFLRRLSTNVPCRCVSGQLLPRLEQAGVEIYLSCPRRGRKGGSSARRTTVVRRARFVPVSERAAVTPVTIRTLPRGREERMVARARGAMAGTRGRGRAGTGQKGGPGRGTTEESGATNGAILTLGGGLLCSLTLTPGVRVRVPMKGQ